MQVEMLDLASKQYNNSLFINWENSPLENHLVFYSYTLTLGFASFSLPQCVIQVQGNPSAIL